MANLLSLITNGLFIAIGLCGIGFLIGIHEFGHFLFCKLFKIATPSFSIGMGPKIWQRKFGKTLFSLSLLPVGGYVEIAGHEEVGQGDQKEAQRRDQYSFANKPYYQKIMVMFGGILFNILFAYITFSALFMLGLPKIALLYPEEIPAVVGTVKPGSAAQQMQLQPSDTIVAINDQKISSLLDLNRTLRTLPGQQVNVAVNRPGSSGLLHFTPTIDTTLDATGQKIGVLGFMPQEPTTFRELAPLSLGQSIVTGFHATNDLIQKTYFSFLVLIKRKSVDGIGGPISVISETVRGARKGLKIFLLLLAFISINLAVLNTIPVPIMDGGQILFVTIEAIIRRPIPECIKMAIHYICWIALMLLIAYISFGDLKRILWEPMSRFWVK